MNANRSYPMKMKKSRIELAREIIANLRRGMNRPEASEKKSSAVLTAEPFMPMPSPPVRRTRQLQTSHS
jgi:hypothetical protein